MLTCECIQKKCHDIEPSICIILIKKLILTTDTCRDGDNYMPKDLIL
jgi:hypothetical protein